MQQWTHFIDGTWLEVTSREQFLPVYNPATGEVYARLARGDQQVVDHAVQAARRAFTKWSKTTIAERAVVLRHFAQAIESRIEQFAQTESFDQGKPQWLASKLDIPRAVQNFRFFASLIEQQTDQAFFGERDFYSLSRRLPVGVAGLISPWNLPLYLLTWKLAPALACGNTVVCKPSEVTPATAHLLAQVIAEEKIVDPGVVNFVFGLGVEVGEALVDHPDVPLISFTGGTQTGRRIAERAGQRLKKISLELGGKNASLVFADVNLAKIVPQLVRSSFLNQGEICLCGSRILVDEQIFEAFATAFVHEVRLLKVGSPQDSDTFMGPLVSAEHFAKVAQHVAQARDRGVQVLTGGEPLAGGPGYYFPPTVLVNPKQQDPIVQQEVFGPVVTLQSFANEEQAVAMANDVAYGLSATVWTESLSRAQKIVPQLKVGTVWVNTWMKRDLRVPFGGVKQSGIGREGGVHSLDFFSETQTQCYFTGE